MFFPCSSAGADVIEDALDRMDPEPSVSFETRIAMIRSVISECAGERAAKLLDGKPAKDWWQILKDHYGLVNAAVEQTRFRLQDILGITLPPGGDIMKFLDELDIAFERLDESHKADLKRQARKEQRTIHPAELVDYFGASAKVTLVKSKLPQDLADVVVRAEDRSKGPFTIDNLRVALRNHASNFQERAAKGAVDFAFPTATPSWGAARIAASHPQPAPA